MTIRAWAGEYDQRITIYANSPTVNPDGQKVEVDGATFQRWARVWPIGGGERVEADQRVADITHEVRMRSDTETRAIAPEGWVKLSDGTRLDVKRSFDAEMKRQEIVLECNERK